MSQPHEDIWDADPEASSTLPSLPAPDYRLTYEIAERIAGSTNLPSHGRSAADAIVLMLSGQELGIPPMQALRSLHLVEGRVELSATLMLGLMVSRMRCRFRWVESTDQQAILELERPGQPLHQQCYSWAMATRAGLTKRQNWVRHPEAMLRARCISAAARSYCPEILSGCYVEGELSEARQLPAQQLEPAELQPPATVVDWAAAGLGCSAELATQKLTAWAGPGATWGAAELQALRTMIHQQGPAAVLAQLQDGGVP